MRRAPIVLAVLALLTCVVAPGTRASKTVEARALHPSVLRRNGAPDEARAPATLDGAVGDGRVGGLASPCGLFLFYSAHDVHFVTLLVGQSVAWLPSDAPTYWMVDGVLLETIVIPQPEIGVAPGASDRDVLHRHRSWELQWTAAERGWKPIDATEVEWAEATGTNLARSIWSYEAPTKLEVLGHQVTRLSYATVALPGWVFVMSAPIRAGDDVATVHRVLHVGAEGVERVASRDELMKEVAILRELSKTSSDCRALLDAVGPRLSAIRKHDGAVDGR